MYYSGIHTAYTYIFPLILVKHIILSHLKSKLNGDLKKANLSYLKGCYLQNGLVVCTFRNGNVTFSLSYGVKRPRISGNSRIGLDHGCNAVIDDVLHKKKAHKLH